VLWHVFEHLYHPNQALAKCSDMLKPGGAIMITCPFHETYTPEKVNPVEHLYYFQQPYVQRFLEKHFGGDTWFDNPYVFARKALV
jgi:2-polyprenyl-3-methyl-5-hydroxy-6-metoxy-1,4-benzoquinol methylase